MSKQNPVTTHFVVRPHDEALRVQLLQYRLTYFYETAANESSGKAWLWTFVARQSTVYPKHATREATPSKPFVEDYFRGIVTFDLTKTYCSLQSLQWCWSHPKHDLQAVIDMGSRFGRWIGSRLRRLTCDLFEHLATLSSGKHFAQSTFVTNPCDMSKNQIVPVVWHTPRERCCARCVRRDSRTRPAAVHILPSRPC
jgi:hypothetical protein